MACLLLNIYLSQDHMFDNCGLALAKLYLFCDSGLTSLTFFGSYLTAIFSI